VTARVIASKKREGRHAEAADHIGGRVVVPRAHGCGLLAGGGGATEPRRMEYLTLASAIDGLVEAGVVEHFGVSDGALRSFDSGRRFSPSSW
jgi:hypothetical protein